MWLYGSGFPKATDISKQLDKKAGEGREIIKTTKSGGYKRLMITNKEQEFRPKDYYPEGNKFKSNNPVTPEAKLWNGWKSHGLKPAYEPILVAMKPNEGSYSDNALKHGVAGLNIDGGRIGTEKWRHKAGKTSPYGNENMWDTKGNTPDIDREGVGRFPANIILDEEAAKMLDEQSGTLKSGDNCKRTKEGFFVEHGGLGKAGDVQTTYGDKGGASRFFYVAKASKAERNMGCEGLIEKKVSDGRVKEADNAYQRGKTLRFNTHPTVKPLKLMEYLCNLTKTPTGGIVLDPFAGSGTTGMVCKKLGRKCILIEKEKNYCKIAKKRIQAITPNLL